MVTRFIRQAIPGNQHLILSVLTVCLLWSAPNKAAASAGIAFDYDGDGKADIAIRRPSNYFQYVKNSSDQSLQRLEFGKHADDIPIVGDFDGDGIYDMAVRRPSNAMWYIRNSSGVDPITGHADGITRFRFGSRLTDQPVPGDYDGDGKTDIAIRRAANLTWYIVNSSGVDEVTGNADGVTRLPFGRFVTDIPVPADYDGDGKADIAVRRPDNGFWYIRNSSGIDYFTNKDDGLTRLRFTGRYSDIPVPADYDGDGKADPAVRRAESYQFIIYNSAGTDFLTGHDDGISRITFGRDSNDILVVADYDGDGRADIATRRAGNKFWYINNTSGADTLTNASDGVSRVRFGLQVSDLPLAQPASITWNNADVDSDGLSYAREKELGTNPGSADSDVDGITDSEELNVYYTNPLEADSDADGVNDGDEIAAGTNPNRANLSDAGLVSSFFYDMKGLESFGARLYPGFTDWVSDVYTFNQNGTGIKYENEHWGKSTAYSFTWQVENARQLSLSLELNTVYVSCYNINGYTSENFPEDVTSQVEQACDQRLFDSDQVALSYGVTESTWRMTDVTSDGFEYTKRNLFTIALDIPDEVLQNFSGNWTVGNNPTHSFEQAESQHEFIAEPQSILKQLTNTNLDGDWVMPVYQSPETGAHADLSYYRSGFFKERLQISGSDATSLTSGLSYRYSQSDEALTLTLDNHKVIITPIKQTGNIITVLSEYYVDTQLQSIYSGQMSQSDNSAAQFINNLQTGEPHIYGNTFNGILSEQRDNEGHIKFENMFAYHFLSDNSLVRLSSPFIEEDHGFWSEPGWSWQSLNAGEKGQPEHTLNLTKQTHFWFRDRYWQILNIDNTGRAVILEFEKISRDDNDDGEFGADESEFLISPRFTIMELSSLDDYAEPWAQTDFDRDGLTNSEEAALGTAYNIADTDGDGFSDGVEVDSMSDPLDADSRPLTLGEIDFPDTNLRFCLGSSDELASSITYVSCRQEFISDLTGIEYLTQLRHLQLSKNSITDISPLASLTGLEYLDLSENNITEVTALAGMTDLETLYLEENQITDISGLATLTALLWLDLSHNPVSDISSLSQMTELVFLDLNYMQIFDLSPLSNLAKAISIDLEGNYIVDLSPLADLTNLTSLSLGNNHIVDLSPLSSLTQINYLSLRNNLIRSVTPLHSLKQLGILELEGNINIPCSEIDELEKSIFPAYISRPSSCPEFASPDMSLIGDANLLSCLEHYNEQPLNKISGISCPDMKISDIAGIEQFFALQSLDLSGNTISDISLLGELDKLRILSVHDNQVSDISALASLSQLMTLNVFRNLISDISPLTNLTKIRYLNLSDNPISDLSPISGYEQLSELYISLIPATDFSVIENFTDLTGLAMSGNQISDLSLVANLEQLETLYIAANNIDDLTPINHLTHLRFLSIMGNNIRDISPISEFNWLYFLNVSDNPIEDLSLLPVARDMTYLWLNRVHSLTDLTLLSQYPNLQFLGIEGNDLTDISVVNDLRRLNRMYANDNQISDLSQIADLNNSLQHLYISNNVVTDVAPLLDFTSLQKLDLSGNNDISCDALGLLVSALSSAEITQPETCSN